MKSPYGKSSTFNVSPNETILFYIFSYLLKNNRNGLGLINPKGNFADYRRLIENYVRSDDIRDMQFEPTFSKEERTTLHQ